MADTLQHFDQLEDRLSKPTPEVVETFRRCEEIGRVYPAYPHLNDDAFVAAHRDWWLGA